MSGYRLTEIEAEPNSADQFVATFVQDTEVSGTWWWYHDLTADEVQARLAEHGARLTRLDVSGKNGSTRYAAVMVANTGSTSVDWWWWIGAPGELAGAAEELDARVIDLERQPDGLVNAVLVRNVNASPSWVYTDLTAPEIDALLAANEARLIDVEPVADGRFDAAMVKSSKRSWWYEGRSPQELIDLANQNGARLVDVEPYETGAGMKYVGIMVTNVSAPTRRVNELMRSAVDNRGSWGLYLKRIGGPELSAINEARRFEPASMIKVLFHLKAIHDRQADLRALDRETITWYKGMSGSCPVDTSPVVEQTSMVLRRMMQYSDNRATKAVVAHFGGPAAMNEFAAAIGAVDTSVNHDIGCFEGAVASPNQVTLRDTGLMYERAAAGPLLSRQAFGKFKELMGTTRLSRIDGIVKGRRAGNGQEAVRGLARRLGLSRARAQAFLSRTRMAWKGGSYTLCTPECRYDWTLGGWASIPFKQRSGRIVRRAYVFGMFTQDASTEAGAARAWDRGPEVLRPVLRRALLSWKWARR